MKMRILLDCFVIYIFIQCIGLVMAQYYDYSSPEGDQEPEYHAPPLSSTDKLISADNKDFMIAYRLPNKYSSVVIKEIYQWGNTKNMLLKTSNGKYLDPTEEIVPLGCTLATKDCKWNLSPGWTYSNWSITEDYFTINVDDLSLKEQECAQNNGGCEVFCHMMDGKATCSCPYGYVNNGSCTFEGYDTSIITKPGNYDYYSRNYNKWLIIPPENSTIHMIVSTQGRRHSYGGGVYLQFKELSTKSNDSFSTFPEYIEYREEKSFTSNSTLEITGILEETTLSIYVDFKRSLLTTEDEGYLTYEIKPKTGYICVCIIYTSPEQNEIINLTAQFSNSTTLEIEEFTERQFNKWKMRCFKQLLPNTFNETVLLKVTVRGSRVTFHSIYGCNNQDVLVTRTVTSFPEIKYQDNERDFEVNSTEQCYNGGKFNLTTQKCTCPEGYMGDACKEACGPYNFGPNCSRECSPFDWGCRGTIFCKDGLPCLCAAGYKGNDCSETCDMQFYGANCLKKCGRCSKGHCDPYTGECEDYSCQLGFHPPLCQIPYLYPKYSPRLIKTDMNSATVQFHVDELLGQGNAHFYQLQYKKSEDSQLEGWIEQQPWKPDGQIITANISDLSAGTSYNVRLILIDEDGNSYGGELVPQAQFSTLCAVPTSTDYNIHHITTTHTIDLSWKYTIHKNDCPITGFTIAIQRKEYTIESNVLKSEEHYSFQNLLSGTSYEVTVKANTLNGPAPSSSVSVKTEDSVPLRVSNLHAKKNGLGKLFISWEIPKFTGGIISKYIILYKCLTIMGCKSCDDSQKEIEVHGSQHSVELSGLKHHTQYLVQVAAMAVDISPLSSVFGLTQDAAPDTAPEAAKRSQLSSTNSSVTIQWLPVNDCEFLNGYLMGYHYRLFAPNNTLLSKGETHKTNITLFNLTPQTIYTIHIFVVSSGGITEDQKLVISAITAATVPDMVQNLTIYKTGRRVLGLRWFQPINTYGEIESFSISHCQLDNCASPMIRIIKPEHCVPWPSHYCHTITGLLPNVEYSVSVRARNVEVDQYGSAATVSATTSEGAPGTPISFRVTKRNTNSLILEWKPPLTFNGVLRSFLINVDQLDSSNATNCCTDFPLHEFMVKSEEEKYIYEVTDLSPASKYNIGISVKTKYIGPTISVTVNTPPEMPKLNNFPELITNNIVKITPEGRFPGLVGTYLLLIFPKNGNSKPVIWDPELSQKFHNIIERNFYIAAEIDAEDMISSEEIEIGKGISQHNGTISILEDPELPSNFDIGLALVLEYNGAANVGVVEAPGVEIE